MKSLIEKLHAALDETERFAQYSGGTGRWEVRERPGSDRAWDVVEGNYVVATVTGSTRVQHVARHDPDSVLHQVAAHRKILELHNYVVKEELRGRLGVPGAGGLVTVYYCPGCSCGRDWDIDGFDSPCPIVLALAEAYGIEVDDE